MSSRAHAGPLGPACFAALRTVTLVARRGGGVPQAGPHSTVRKQCMLVCTCQGGPACACTWATQYGAQAVHVHVRGGARMRMHLWAPVWACEGISSTPVSTKGSSSRAFLCYMWRHARACAYGVEALQRGKAPPAMVCMHPHTHTGPRARARAHTHTHTHSRAHTHTLACTHAHTRVHTRTHMHAQTHVHVGACAHTHLSMASTHACSMPASSSRGPAHPATVASTAPAGCAAQLRLRIARVHAHAHKRLEVQILAKCRAHAEHSSHAQHMRCTALACFPCNMAHSVLHALSVACLPCNMAHSVSQIVCGRHQAARVDWCYMHSVCGCLPHTHSSTSTRASGRAWPPRPHMPLPLPPLQTHKRTCTHT